MFYPSSIVIIRLRVMEDIPSGIGKSVKEFLRLLGTSRSSKQFSEVTYAELAYV